MEIKVLGPGCAKCNKLYDEARKAFAIVQASGERRPYANFILTKGVVGPDGKDLLP